MSRMADLDTLFDQAIDHIESMVEQMPELDNFTATSLQIEQLTLGLAPVWGDALRPELYRWARERYACTLH